ncbi:MAG: hypothetical protein COV44_03830 [Deltaproteobacteria bacterium CG11_big_fil_rev_8_21_14_0_20_45_16]|nr:MAG: hypothetical protein COV44_03830 [Deltaproteobacteria bacterium CG11_big_fil_rev_8_21_14_0_20_45_16]PIS10112.1 MAG: hypothetical protein COT73_11070 [Bdellovibrio sp. CG10_big_fil_rev_8_21_14_0_10_47_8]
MNAAEEEIKELRKRQEKILTQSDRKMWSAVEEHGESPELRNQARAKEFVELLKDADGRPVAELNTGVSRRDFFKWVSAAGALMTSSACTRRPKDLLIPFVNKPEGYTYGAPVWYASTSPSGLGVLVKTREGRPIKLEGNPDHPQSKGGLNAQTQAEILNLYNPERLQAPLDQSGKKISWSNADETIKSALAAAPAGSVRLLSGDFTSPSLASAIRNFSDRYKAQHTVLSSLPYIHLARANEMIGGSRGIPEFDFTKADVVLSVDCDFLGSWLRPVEFTKAFSSRRNLHRENKDVNRLFCFESMLSTTGTSSDARYSIKPSQQLDVLLAVASELSKVLRFDPSFQEILSSYSSDKVGAAVGIAPEVFQEVAMALAEARGKSLVVAGGFGPQALEAQLACMAINVVLGNIGSTVNTGRHLVSYEQSEVRFQELIQDAMNAQVSVLIIRESDAAYTRANSDFAKACRKIPLIVYLGRETNDTSKLAHLVLPESHFLEAWGDSEAYSGIVSIQQPAIQPIFDSRSFLECLLVWMGSDQTKAKDYVQRHSGVGTAWEKTLRDGFVQRSQAALNFSPRWSAAAAAIAAAPKSGNAMELVSYASIQMGDGSFANNAWLMEMPDPISKVTWDNFAALSPATAKKLGIRERKPSDDCVDQIEIKSGASRIKLPVFLIPGLRDDVVGVALGYGRREAGSIGSGVGANAFALGRQAATGELQLSGQEVEVVKIGEKHLLACTQRHFDIHGRDNDILQRTTLAEFLKDPKAAKKIEFEGESMYEKFHYPGHRWGMSIDLNKCTGCHACVISCQSENNVPVVGKDQVSRGRYMGWLRLDLYHWGEPDNLEASSFEPMLCQQCESAPCETVCPVLATVHSSDGLNDMVYNRCVGTRYCANNCPYKVRHFNFFQYSDALAGKVNVDAASPLAMMLNPDVTVRTRGVMEKCTFCVQRIRKGVDVFKAKGESKVEDGAIKTACQQSCPADAISFGDINDPNSDVSRMAAKAQSFKVLEVLNTNPSVSYLPRVYNKGASS